MDLWLHALNRFGLGARIGEGSAPGAADPRGWLRDQLDPDLALVDAAGLPRLEEIAEVLAAQRRAARSRDEGDRRAAARRLREVVARESVAALSRRVSSDAPFVERLVAFWSNHLCVSAQGGPLVAALAGHYERTVVRPHVLGRFGDMVLASARHPAMLVYLDNVRSIGPGSRVGTATSRRGPGRGLNENYARELLELHTLGVDGGYDQDDVEALARILTGWSTDPGREGAPARGARRAGAPADPLTFVFRPEIHEPGAKTVLGRRYPEGGVAEGEALIRDLAGHPSTGRHLATKLVRHLVSDDPPASAIDRLASVWTDTGGDLGAVTEALVDLEEAWDPAHRKLRTPQEWTVAALRAVSARTFPAPLLEVLRQLRHPLWAPAAPKGFDDVARSWSDPDALMNRAELARTLAQRLDSGMEPRRLLEVVEPADDGVLASMLSDRTIPADERFALALAGPAFQWR